MEKPAPMIEPIENVLDTVSGANLEERPQIQKIPVEMVNKKQEVVVVTTLKEEPVDFKSAIKTSLDKPTNKMAKTPTKKRKRCSKGKRRNRRTHRCRKNKR